MKIVFKNEDNTIGVINPTEECLAIHTIEEIANKDVPFGLEYWIVKDDEIPTDRTFRTAWEIPSSWGDSTGIGSEYNSFPIRSEK